MGFTLVEMLATIAIIAILAGLALGTLFLSQQAARREKTRSLIAKLDGQMALRWESYRTRRLPIQMGIINGVPTPETPDEFAYRQLQTRRALMRLELPETYFDLVWAQEQTIVPVPAVTRSYQRRVLQAINQKRATPIPPSAWNPSDSNYSDLEDELLILAAENQSAEMLYLILTTGVETDATGRKVLRNADIGDTEEPESDGMLEFVDGWGNAIRWIRWPAGFVSDVQPTYPHPTNPGQLTRFDPLGANPDPFDPRRVDTAWPTLDEWPPFSPKPPVNPNDTYTGTPTLAIDRGFRIKPLIVSAGPDGSVRGPDYDPFALLFIAEDRNDPRHLDPYAFFQVTFNIGGSEETRWVQRGVWYQPVFGGHFDNIHNHMLGSP